ncbi:hypothetical protein C8R43DRAFT_1104083, partial [Mycena crocata]
PHRFAQGSRVVRQCLRVPSGDPACVLPRWHDSRKPGHRCGFQSALCGATGTGREASLGSGRDGGGGGRVEREKYV